MLYGRDHSEAQIDRLLEQAQAGRGGALVLRGEAGIGKTALLAYAASTAGPQGSDGPNTSHGAVFQVLSVVGVEAESTLGYAGLQALLTTPASSGSLWVDSAADPGGTATAAGSGSTAGAGSSAGADEDGTIPGRRTAADGMDALPEPQARAIRGALGLELTEQRVSEDRLLVGLAVMNLLSEFAEHCPVLVLVDDAHWLDQESADALVLAARRLRTEPVAIVFAVREPHAPVLATPGLPELRVPRLERFAAADLLDVWHPRLPAAAREHVLVEASGNPLALRELPGARRASGARLAATSGQPTHRRVARRESEHSPPDSQADPPGHVDRVRQLRQAGESARADQAGAASLAGDAGGGLTGADTIGRIFAERLAGLPDMTRRALSVAAADDTGSSDIVLRAIERLGGTAADLEPAERDQLLWIAEPAVVFGHPLVRSAAYASASAHGRMEAHRALATVLDAPEQRDRRAWHRAAATIGTDEAVAAELERAAERARIRGGSSAAAAAYERAADLSSDSERRVAATIAAARAAADAAAYEKAATLLNGLTGAGTWGHGDAVDADVPDTAGTPPAATDTPAASGAGGAAERVGIGAGTRAAIARVWALLPEGLRPRPTQELLVWAAMELDRDEQIWHEAARAAWTANDFETLHKIASCRETLPRAGALAGAAIATNRLSEGNYDDGVRELRELLAEWPDMPETLGTRTRAASASVNAGLAGTGKAGIGDIDNTADIGMAETGAVDAANAANPANPANPGNAADADDDVTGTNEGASATVGGSVTGEPDVSDPVRALRDAVLRSRLLLIVGEIEHARTVANQLEQQARRVGAISVLPELQVIQARCALFIGAPRDAQVAATEGLELANDIGQPVPAAELSAILAELAALRGDEQAVQSLVTEPLNRGIAPASVHAASAWSLLDLGLGRYDSAYDRLESMLRGGRSMGVPAALPTMVEAAVRAGHPAAAETPLALYEQWAEHVAQPWTRAVSARCRALVFDQPELFAEAAGPDAFPLDRARAELLHGERLRRDRRLIQARTRLRSALETFERLGVTPWAERARSELRATGETRTAREHGVAPTERLTPQELQVARLAAAGASNREIGERLFLSPRTVGYHLAKTYPKLGIRSRTELAGLLAAEGGQTDGGTDSAQGTVPNDESAASEG